MTVLRLEPPIWLHTPKGLARAVFLIISSEESDDLWKCVQQDTGEWWTWSNEDVRATKNITMGRTQITPVEGTRSVQQIYDDMCAKGII